MSSFEKGNYKSPLGWLELGADAEGVLYATFLDAEVSEPKEACTNTHLKQLVRELTEYFQGERKVFEVKLKLEGTDFQQRVWNELLNIPFGSTRTYMQQTKALGDPKAIRAVASANGKNKHAIIIPCHRVLGSNGTLTGYAGGLWRKKWLLEYEKEKSGKAIQKELF